MGLSNNQWRDFNLGAVTGGLANLWFTYEWYKENKGDGNIIEQRYAAYLESYHAEYLKKSVDAGDTILDEDSPFSDYTDIACNVGFFGTGYLLADFPAMYDMFGKSMAGLDIDVLYSEAFEDTLNTPEINELVAAEADLIDDDIEINIMPGLMTSMRDSNSVISSSFLMEKAVVEEARVETLSAYSGELKYRVLPLVSDRWKIRLGWQENTILLYASIMKFYFSAKMDTDDSNYNMSAKDVLWPFTVFEYERVALGILQGAKKTTYEPSGSEKRQKALSGAVSGAATGAAVASVIPGFGTLVGAVLGAVIGYSASMA